MNKKQIAEAEKWIEDRIATAQQDIKNLRKSKKLLAEGKCHFRINLTSLWKQEGEKGLRYDAPVGQSLGKAAKIADEKFMAQNHRSDVQADRAAWLFIDGGLDKDGYPWGERIYFEHPMEVERIRERRRVLLEKQKQDMEEGTTTIS